MSIGLLLSDDMLFNSRIAGTARGLNLVIKLAHTSNALEALARQQTPRCVILDLANPGLDVGGLLARLREACTPMPRVVAYGSHVDTATLKRAREAGCDVVWPRSKFVEELPRALAEWFGIAPSAGGAEGQTR